MPGLTYFLETWHYLPACNTLRMLLRITFAHCITMVLENFVGNGHGGNIPARNRVVEVANQLPDLQARWYDWWLAHSVQQVAEKHNLKPSHANWLEAFPFTLVSDVPAEPKIPPTYQGLQNAKETRKVFGDGNFGGPYKVDQAIMDELFAASLQDILHLLEF